MKSVLLACILLAAGVCPGFGKGEPGPKSFEAVEILGKEYVRLADWAGAYDFTMRWLKRSESLQLSNRWAKLVFTVDSCQAQVNGVEVWLLFPVAEKYGGFYVTRADLETTLYPLLFPARATSSRGIRTVCLDPGHGGADSGNRAGSRQEKEYTLLLAKEVREQLAKAGLSVVLTRNNDVALELPDRPKLAHEHKADLMVSLHFNSAPSNRDTVKGAEVYCLTPVGANSTNGGGEGGSYYGNCIGNRQDERNLLLAYQVQRALITRLGVEDRGVRRARFAVLRDAVMPAILVEGGFMSHPAEGKRIFDSGYRHQMARAIVNGVLAYKRLIERGGESHYASAAGSTADEHAEVAKKAAE